MKPVTVVLLAVIGLWAVALFLKDRQPARVGWENPPGPEVPVPPIHPYVPIPPPYEPKVTRENYDKLEVGMTQEQLEGILGKGRLAAADDPEPNYIVYATDSTQAWYEAAKEGRVYMWKGAGTVIAGYLGDPRAGSKAVALGYFRLSGDVRELRGSLRRVTEENFARLTVGMTVAELQVPLGKGRR